MPFFIANTYIFGMIACYFWTKNTPYFLNAILRESKQKNGSSRGNARFWDLKKSEQFEVGIEFFSLSLALQIEEKLFAEHLALQNSVVGAPVGKEDEKDRSELRPCHLIFSTLNHTESDTRNAGTVAELRLRKKKIFSESYKIFAKNVFGFLAFFFRKLDSVLSIFHKYAPHST